MKYFWQICCTCLISLLFYFFSSLRRGDQSTVFCIVSSDFNWSRTPKIGHHFALVCRCCLADIRRFFTKAPSTPAEEIWKRRFHSENASYVFGSHLEGEIWKRTFYSESASNELENGGFTRKTHQMFSAVYTTPEELEIASIIDHFRFVFEGNQGNHIIIDAKSFVYKTFSVHTETKMQRF